MLSAETNDSNQGNQEGLSAPQSASQNQNTSQTNLKTAQDWNRRLKELLDSNPSAPAVSAGEYRIGPEDVLNINIFEAQELNREVRVSAGGDISLPLLGSVRAAGLTPRELEFVLQELLHRTYMKDPHVSVFVREMQSHPVSVMGRLDGRGCSRSVEARRCLRFCPSRKAWPTMPEKLPSFCEVRLCPQNQSQPQIVPPQQINLPPARKTLSRRRRWPRTSKAIDPYPKMPCR